MRLKFAMANACLWALVFWGSPLPLASAAANQPLTLTEAVRLTLEQSPELNLFQFSAQALNARRQNQNLAPPIALELELENFAGSNDLKGFDAAEITLALSSVLELGGKREARVTVADAHIQQQKDEQSAAALSVLSAVTQQFIDALTTQYQLEVAAQATDLSHSLLQAALQRARQGAASEAEVMRAKANASLTQLRYQALKHQWLREQHKLAASWGELNPGFNQLTGDLFAVQASPSFTSLYQQALASPSLAVLASEARIEQARLKLAQSEAHADLTWRVGIKQLRELDTTAFTAGISLPLNNAKRTRSSVREAEARVNGLDATTAQARIALHQQLYQAWSLHAQSLATVTQMQTQVVPALARALLLIREGYEAGRDRYQDWVNAQEELLAAKQQMIEAASTALTSQAIIEELTGQALTP